MLTNPGNNGMLRGVNAITEDENEISMRDAGASKDRPRIEGYDMDADTMKAADEKKEAFSFNADVEIVGNISKSSGTFKIDHPLPEKSETHHLVHSFLIILN